ncbi:MAG: type II toxin-antitoxin system Phd/YefM family antitoxin [Candidatus Omnitrophica bacterium]|nr:type II toxin-antitoxin system Phd/YefM family antitoxin [Candidatus Omnitrophota bacterium]
MKMVSALTVRKQFGLILDEVAKGKEPIAITRANRPMVVMEPYAVYEARTNQEARRKRLTEVARRMDELVERNAKYLKKGPDAVTLIRKLRDSR